MNGPGVERKQGTLKEWKEIQSDKGTWEGSTDREIYRGAHL